MTHRTMSERSYHGATSRFHAWNKSNVAQHTEKCFAIHAAVKLCDIIRPLQFFKQDDRYVHHFQPPLFASAYSKLILSFVFL